MDFFTLSLMVCIIIFKSSFNSCEILTAFFSKDKPLPDNTQILSDEFFKPSSQLNQDSLPLSFNISFDNNGQQYEFHFSMDSFAPLKEVHTRSDEEHATRHDLVCSRCLCLPHSFVNKTWRFFKLKHVAYAHYHGEDGSSATLTLDNLENGNSNIRLVSS